MIDGRPGGHSGHIAARRRDAREPAPRMIYKSCLDHQPHFNKMHMMSLQVNDKFAFKVIVAVFRPDIIFHV